MEEVTPQLVRAARKGRKNAVVEVLAMHYPIVWRMASGLAGRDDVGRGVVRFVMQRSLRVLHQWRDEIAPTRWFAHHTVLTVRRAQRHPPGPTGDTLLPDAGELDYAAFIRALRNLHMQQREAFILTHGERIDVRAVSVAMDCSTHAVENHLREATARLRELADDKYDAHVARMAETYRKLGPDEQLAVKDIRRRVERFVIPWLIRRAIRFGLSLVIMALAVWAAWWAWQIVRHSIG